LRARVARRFYTFGTAEQPRGPAGGGVPLGTTAPRPAGMQPEQRRLPAALTGLFRPPSLPSHLGMVGSTQTEFLQSTTLGNEDRGTIGAPMIETSPTPSGPRGLPLRPRREQQRWVAGDMTASITSPGIATGKPAPWRREERWRRACQRSVVISMVLWLFENRRHARCPQCRSGSCCDGRHA